MGEGIVERLADLFAETGQAHHSAFIETDGEDPDWPLWYSEYLLDKLPALLGATLTRSEIVYLVVSADKHHALEAPGSPWPRYYGVFLMRRYGLS